MNFLPIIILVYLFVKRRYIGSLRMNAIAWALSETLLLNSKKFLMFFYSPNPFG